MEETSNMMALSKSENKGSIKKKLYFPPKKYLSELGQ
jgi:hypothetical protein